MIWNSASDFFHMGGYGFYVWGSYIVCVVFMLAEPLLARHRHRQALRNAAALNRDQEDPS